MSPGQQMINDSSHLETEYLKMSQNLSLDIIKYLTIFLIFIHINEAVVAIFNSQITTFIFVVSITIASSFPLRAIWTKKNNYETIITVFCVLIYMTGLIFNKVDDRYFRNPFASFYLSYSYCIFEKILAEGIANVKHRISFNILALVLRFLTVPYNDIVAYAIHLFVSSISIFVAIYRERSNKRFFVSYYHSNDQLSKFKDLVVQHIPEAILIVSQDLTKSLFVNNSFLSQVDITMHIHKQLSHFLIIDEAIPNSKTSFLDSPPVTPVRRTLLDILRSSEHLKNGTYMVRSIHGTPSKREFQFETEKDQENLFQAKITSLTWDNEPSFGIILHDITQHHTIMSLKIANTQKDKVLATVSHELKTPLNGILGMIQIMEKKIKDSELLSFLAICKTSTNLLVSLVSSILDLNQINANKIQLNIEKIEVRELLRSIMSLFEYQCRQKGIYLKATVKPGTPIFLNTDKDRLSQVLINLVGNAQKFTSKGGIFVAAELDGKDSVKFTVEDTGIGIAKEDKEKLFQVFGKIDQGNRKINRQGVGLGLTIAETLVEVLNEGNKQIGTREIHVESELGKGCVFSFTVKNRTIAKEVTSNNDKSDCYQQDLEVTLPTIPNEEDENYENCTECNLFSSGLLSTVASHVKMSSVIKQRSQSENTTEPKCTESLFKSSRNYNLLTKPWVVIVDDNLFNIAVAEHLISSHGYQVKTAFSGQGAIDIITHNDQSSSPIGLVLMDCQMPIMDGYETTRRLRRMMDMKIIPQIPIVALTANDSEADKMSCKKAGMCDHLSKPLKDSELSRIFKKYCN